MNERTPEAVMSLVRGLDVQNNFAFLPHRRVMEDGSLSPMLSLCNCYVTCCTAALGCAIPAKKANNQVEWLISTSGQLAGWMHVDSETARQRATLGFPTVAAWVNQTGHGHIALLVPPPQGETRLFVSAAGTQNFTAAPIEKSFGVGKDVHFWTHG